MACGTPFTIQPRKSKSHPHPRTPTHDYAQRSWVQRHRPFGFGPLPPLAAAELGGCHQCLDCAAHNCAPAALVKQGSRPQLLRACCCRWGITCSSTMLMSYCKNLVLREKLDCGAPLNNAHKTLSLVRVPNTY
eukprot:1147003-Pelagomonas_calceolata.AAC.5